MVSLSGHSVYYIDVLIMWFCLLSVSQAYTDVNKQCSQRQFRLKSIGLLTDAYKVLFSGYGGSFHAALRDCTEFCWGERRCIGIEVCQIREDVYRCRVCCEWIKLGEKTEISNDMVACRYYEMKEETVNIAISKPATMSSEFPKTNQVASNAVDNVLKCTLTFLAHTNEDFQPWIKIDLQAIYDVRKVTIFNRQDCCGKRLHDVQMNIINNGTEASCGFYKGPADLGDRISVYCVSGSVGRYVLITILSQPGIVEYLTVCEIQVFVNL